MGATQSCERKYGWIRDQPDRRDLVHTFSESRKRVTSHTSNVDLRVKGMPDVYDQEAIGSCTANATGGLFEYDVIKQYGEGWIPSRLFIYYFARARQHNENFDTGSTIRDCMKVLASKGVCHESDWVYQEALLTDRPSRSSIEKALNHRITKYKRIPQTLEDIKTCLHAGFPVAFGFTVYESFHTIGSDGKMPIPDESENILGGHAVLAVGYDDNAQVLIVRNSWGEKWGDHGYFYMSYSVLDTCSDFWTAYTVIDNQDPLDAASKQTFELVDSSESEVDE